MAKENKRTANFFNQSVEELADEFVEGSVEIELPMLDRKIRVNDLEIWTPVGTRYEAIYNMSPGTFWNPPQRRIYQSLITTNPVGSCLRLLQADYFDPVSKLFVPKLELDGDIYKPGEGNIARYLQMQKHQRSQLRFIDDSNTLYIFPIEAA